MSAGSKQELLKILHLFETGIFTNDEAVFQLLYAISAIDGPMEIRELMSLVSDEMRGAICRFVDRMPKTDIAWEAEPQVFILDGDDQTLLELRARFRSAVEAVRSFEA